MSEINQCWKKNFHLGSLVDFKLSITVLFHPKHQRASVYKQKVLMWRVRHNAVREGGKGRVRPVVQIASPY